MKQKLPQLILVFLAICLPFLTAAQEIPVKPTDKTEPPEKPEAIAGKVEIATFAGGCFWCTEAYFERLQGVQRVISGYSGGQEKNPTYKEVSAGKTGHAESVQIIYDPEMISYRELLEVFFATHDPTTLNRQGPDVGKQYRSVVFYHNASQKAQAEKYMAELAKSGKFHDKIVTQLVPYERFWPAEKYHQDYYANNPRDPYVQSVARPKVQKFEKNFASKLKKAYRQ